MTAKPISQFSLRFATTASLTLAFISPCLPQSAPTVFVNPRAESTDPRVGLKGGLYDAGEAASGMQRIASLPKPPGFDAVTNTPAAPAEGDRPARFLV